MFIIVYILGRKRAVSSADIQGSEEYRAYVLPFAWRWVLRDQIEMNAFT